MIRSTGGRAGGWRPGLRAAVLAVLGVVILAGCTIQLDTPKLELTTKPAYSSKFVLMPYELRGDGTYAEARWILRHYRTDVGEWELTQSWDVSVPNGSSGILQLELGDGKYEITAELLTSRGRLSVPAPALTTQAEFYVDTMAPRGNIILNDNQGGGPDPLSSYSAASALEIYPSYADTPDPDYESPVALYHVLDSTVPPTADQAPTEATVQLWAGGAPSYSRVLTIIAVDQAGNVGSYRVATYTGT
jgi:hypothetical protein